MENRGARLAEYIRTRPDFTVVASIDEPYRHMGATLSDAVLQAGVNYKTVVEPRVERLRTKYPDATTTSAFAALLATHGAEELLNWKGRKKIETLEQLIALLTSQKVETEQDFCTWIVADGNVGRLRGIKGIKEKTTDYLAILLGIPNVAVDRHLFRFLAEAGIQTAGDYGETQRIIREAADFMGVPASILDHSVWRHMSERRTAGEGEHSESLCRAQK